MVGCSLYFIVEIIVNMLIYNFLSDSIFLSVVMFLCPSGETPDLDGSGIFSNGQNQNQNQQQQSQNQGGSEQNGKWVVAKTNFGGCNSRRSPQQETDTLRLNHVYT